MTTMTRPLHSFTCLLLLLSCATFPKSTYAMRPSLSAKMFPGCGSPWNSPNSSSCRSPDTTPTLMKLPTSMPPFRIPETVEHKSNRAQCGQVHTRLNSSQVTTPERAAVLLLLPRGTKGNVLQHQACCKESTSTHQQGESHPTWTTAVKLQKSTLHVGAFTILVVSLHITTFIPFPNRPIIACNSSNTLQLDAAMFCNRSGIRTHLLCDH